MHYNTVSVGWCIVATPGGEEAEDGKVSLGDEHRETCYLLSTKRQCNISQERGQKICGDKLTECKLPLCVLQQ